MFLHKSLDKISNISCMSCKYENVSELNMNVNSYRCKECYNVTFHQIRQFVEIAFAQWNDAHLQDCSQFVAIEKNICNGYDMDMTGDFTFHQISQFVANVNIYRDCTQRCTQRHSTLFP